MQLIYTLLYQMAKIVAGSVNPVPSCSSFKRDSFFIYTRWPLAVLSHLRTRFADIPGHCVHAQSQGRRQSATAKPRLHSVCYYFYFYFASILQILLTNKSSLKGGGKNFIPEQKRLLKLYHPQPGDMYRPCRRKEEQESHFLDNEYELLPLL